jgi:hypothetical protein
LDLINIAHSLIEAVIVFNPTGFQFLGFAAASILFDATTGIIGHNNLFKQRILTLANIVPISTLSAALAGYLIGAFFMADLALNAWGGVLGWASIHAAGGIVGGTISLLIVTNLKVRKIFQ